MRYLPQLGIAAPELDWVPSPSFVLRRSAIFDVLDGLPPGRVLEMGCGPGGLLYDLARRGFTGAGVELSERAREVAEHILVEAPGVEVRAALPGLEEGLYDYLFSFEVLEHIEDDRGALTAWLERLKPGGTVVLSVPAHREKWNITDKLVGHYRRYDRADVITLLRDAGLDLHRLETYGFPASWAIERARVLAYALRARARGQDVDTLEDGDVELTKDSGTDRALEAGFFPLYASLPGRYALAAAARVQRRFARFDWGISYLAVAQKPG